MGPQHWLAAGALSAAIGVGLGAFGAHGLKGKLTPEMLAVFETGVRYQLYHALALLAVGWAASRWPASTIHASGWLFVAGTLIFCGSLYLLAVSGIRGLGAITPLGGLAFIAGWLALAIGALRAS